MHDALISAAGDVFPTVRSDLERLVKIPSVSAAGFDAAAVHESAVATAEVLEAAGFAGTRLLELDAAHPAVFGEIPGPPDAPTVLLYAHHDVQPAGPSGDWHSPPFTPTERGGRLYGRGTSDDKCGIVIHAAVARLLGPRPPVGIKVFAEGEEEIGSRHLVSFLETHGELLAADAIVIADSANWRVGTPALTTSLRGLVDCVVEVRTLAAGVHSGQFGGAFPDALTVLSRLLATLHRPDGSVAVPGLLTGPADPLDLTEDELRDQAGAVPSLQVIGSGTLTARMWTQPAVSVLAVDAPSVDHAINQLVPAARAKVSLRLAPGDDPRRAMDALAHHLEDNVPWGAAVTVTPGSAGDAFALATAGPAYDAFRAGMRSAWEREPVEIGVGGSIPFVGAFAEAYPEAAILITGVADPLSAAHGPNESLDLGELRRGLAAEAIALATLGS
jgi:acetylornithine deacetylase/succinyl-diaminopimelate desuccinylase-like protein